MDLEKACELLGVAPNTQMDAIREAYTSKRTALVERVDKAPTEVLKSKYDGMVQELDQAFQAIQIASSAVSGPVAPVQQPMPTPAGGIQTPQQQTPFAGPVIPTPAGGMPMPPQAATPAGGIPQQPTPAAGIQAGMLAPGQVLMQRYQVRQIIGEGGMGQVYCAFDGGRQEDVAVKVLRPDLISDEKAKERFISEAQVTGKLSHPNVVKVFDVQVGDGLHFFTMELLEGQTLRQEMQVRKSLQRQYLPEEVIKTALPICEALQYAHAYTVHRDVKPENIWLSEDDTVRLMDFGIAALQTQHPITTAGKAMGTAFYMAPEQLQGATNVDGRADQYSLAVVMYEMLTGEVPSGRAASVSEKRKDVPKALSETLDRALNPEPNERFPSMSEFSTALAAAKGKIKGKTSGGSGKSGIPKWLKVAAIIFLLAGLGGVGFWQWTELQVKWAFAAERSKARTALEKARENGKSIIDLQSSIQSLQKFRDKYSIGSEINNEPPSAMLRFKRRLAIPHIESLLGILKEQRNTLRAWEIDAAVQKAQDTGLDRKKVDEAVAELAAIEKKYSEFKDDLNRVRTKRRELTLKRSRIEINETVKTARAKAGKPGIYSAELEALNGLKQKYTGQEELELDAIDEAIALLNTAGLRHRIAQALTESNQIAGDQMALQTMVEKLKFLEEEGRKSPQVSLTALRDRRVALENKNARLELKNATKMAKEKSAGPVLKREELESLLTESQAVLDKHAGRPAGELQELQTARKKLAFQGQRYEIEDLLKKMEGAKRYYGDELTRAIASLREMQKTYHKQPSAILKPIGDKIEILMMRESQLNTRLSRYKTMLQDAERELLKDPKSALAKLEKARTYGEAKPAEGLPGILEEGLPSYSQVRKSIQSRLNAIEQAKAEKVRQALEKKLRAEFEEAFDVAKIERDREDWKSVANRLGKAIGALGTLNHPQRSAAEKLLAQARAETAKQFGYAGNIKKGDELYLTGKFLEARRAFDAALRAWPDAPGRKGLKDKIKRCTVEAIKKAHADATALRKSNPSGAIVHFKTAAGLGHPNSLHALGEMYEKGSGTAVDKGVAARWYEKAANLEYRNSQFRLAQMYDNGIGVETDDVAAAKWYAKAAVAGDIQAQHRLGMMFLRSDGIKFNGTQAERYLKMAAGNKVVEAQYELGAMYLYARGIKRNMPEAAKWLRTAATAGHLQSTHLMGDLYSNGWGVPKNLTEAPTWYTKAAKKGHAGSQFALGNIYIAGLGVKRDRDVAAHWYLKSAQQNHFKAQHRIGQMYFQGQGVKKNYATAAQWIIKSAKQGYAPAQYYLAEMYIEGKGVAKVYKTAVEWLYKAANQNHADAQFLLAEMYEKGKGVHKSEAQALEWYRKAAKNGHQKAAGKLK